MKNKKILVISLILLAMVLIGVTIIGPIVKMFNWVIPFQPVIILTGFFIFLVAVSLFVYVLISNLKR